jgi:hypothetical protein
MHKNSKFLQKYGSLLTFSIIFWSFYLSALFQGWNAFTLLVIPLFQYLLFGWTHLFGILKTPVTFHFYQIQYECFGNTRRISRNFYVLSLVEIILIILMGIESFYHPQLVTNYFVLYLIPIVLIYIFSTLFSMNSLISEAKIVIYYGKQDNSTIQLKNPIKKQIFIGSLIVTVSLSVLWICFSILGHFGIFSYTILVPYSSEQLKVSLLYVIVILFSFIHPIVLLGYIHYSILKNSILDINKREGNDQRILLGMIKNYIIFPRFFKAWL